MSFHKQPVSLLQEIMVKKGIFPIYKSLPIEGGLHENIFKIQVICDQLTAIGTGRCKKDAKHEAAIAMLEKVEHNALPRLSISPCEYSIQSSICPKSPANIQLYNIVGELQELCTLKKLGDPIYKDAGDIGPPHAKVFIVQCTVSTFEEEGKSTTKQRAKHEAARKMINRIKGITDKINIEEADNKIKENSINNKSIKFKRNYNDEDSIDGFKRFKGDFDEEIKNNLIVKLEDSNELLKYFLTNNEISEEQFTKLKQNFNNIIEFIDSRRNKG